MEMNICKKMYVMSLELGLIKWNKNIPTNDKIKLETGPAAATLIISLVGLFNLYGLTGTGLA